MLNSIPITWRILFATAVPVIALVLFAFAITSTQMRTVGEMQKLQSATEFTRGLSQLIHELQRERGRSAGFVGSQGAAEYRTSLMTQRQTTDSALAEYQTAKAALLATINDGHLRQTLMDVETRLGELTAHRRAIDGLSLSLGQTVAPYSQTISTGLGVVSELAHFGNNSDLSAMMVGLLNLMTAKENAGIERAIGSNIFASGSIDQVRHARALDLISRQNAFLEEFVSLMGQDWETRLEALNTSPESRAVFEARTVIVDAGYGGPVAGYTGTDWFALTTDRIDLLMGLEVQLTRTIQNEAQAIRTEAERTSFWVVVISVLSVLVALVISFIMMMSVVKPLSNITNALASLAEGVTDVKIEGAQRGDEIGVLARTANAFRLTSEERENAIAERNEAEKKALSERRRTLAEMAHQVIKATSSSVGHVSESADALVQSSEKVQSTLNTAGDKALEAGQATTQTLERSERATELASELTTAIGEVTEQITRGDNLVRDAVSRAAQSRESVEELNQAAQQISDFIGLINDLAEQTNLLALNATIEAARAGEAGKGFAVVASEVKALAAQTNKSTTEIADRVNQIQSRTQSTVEAMGSITDAIDQIGEVTAAVAAAMEEQRVSTGAFSSFVDENRDAMSAVNTAVQTLSELAKTAETDIGAMAGSVNTMAQSAGEASVDIPKIVKEAVDRAERRTNTRFNAIGSATLLVNGKAHTVELSDISSNGARLVVKGVDVPADTPVQVTHANFSGDGVVVWADAEALGVMLTTPVTKSAIEAITAKSQTAA